MQDKQIVMVRYKEDRDRLITKLKYPTIVYCTGPEPHPSEIPIPNIALETYGFAKYLVDHYDNLPEYTIFSQADPDPHVESFELAIDSTFTGGFGSFCYARSIHNQHAIGNVMLYPLKQIMNELGIFFKNDTSKIKPMYLTLPGMVFYLHRNKILEKPKYFYEKLLSMCNDQYMSDLITNYKYPNWFYNEIIFHYPDLNGMPRKEKLKLLADPYRCGSIRPGNFVSGSFECLWWTMFQSKENLEKLDKKLITMDKKIDIMFFRNMENDWFKWDCPYYLKWREKLIEKTMREGQQRGFDGKQLLEFYERVGYKHISL